jgi:hypothetical protein
MDENGKFESLYLIAKAGHKLSTVDGFSVDGKSVGLSAVDGKSVGIRRTIQEYKLKEEKEKKKKKENASLSPGITPREILANEENFSNYIDHIKKIGKTDFASPEFEAEFDRYENANRAPSKNGVALSPLGNDLGGQSGATVKEFKGTYIVPQGDYVTLEEPNPVFEPSHQKELAKIENESLNFTNIQEAVQKLLEQKKVPYIKIPLKESQALNKFVLDGSIPKRILELIRKLVEIKSHPKYVRDNFWIGAAVNIAGAYSFQVQIETTYETIKPREVVSTLPVTKSESWQDFLSYLEAKFPPNRVEEAKKIHGKIKNKTLYYTGDVSDFMKMILQMYWTSERGIQINGN